MKHLIATVIACGLSFLAQTLHASGYGATYDPSRAGLTQQEKLDQYLFRAAREGDVPVLETFVDSQYDLNRQDAKGYTPLILAAYHGHEPAVDLLLAAGVNPCTKDKRGNTALFGAIFKGEFSIVKKLINKDCVDSANNAGQTPAMYAALFGRLDALEVLEEHGADLSKEDQFGNKVENLKQGEIKTQLKDIAAQ